MAKSVYVAAFGRDSGKSLVSLGVVNLLSSQIARVGYFRPVVAARSPEHDPQIQLMKTRCHPGLSAEDMVGVPSRRAKDLLLSGQEEVLHKEIVQRFEAVQSQCDFVIIEGTDYRGNTTPFDFRFNLEVISNIGSLILPVMNGGENDPNEVSDRLGLLREMVKAAGATLAGTIITRVADENRDSLLASLHEKFPEMQSPLYALGINERLERPTVGDVARHVDAEVLHGGADHLNREVQDIKVAAMQIPNFLEYLSDGCLVVTAGDRADVILACVATLVSTKHPKIAGLLLTGGLSPGGTVINLIDCLTDVPVAIIRVHTDTYNAVASLGNVKPSVTADNESRVAGTLALFDRGFDPEPFYKILRFAKAERVTPIMFEHHLMLQARSQKKRIVLAEGEEERVMRAAEILLQREVADIILLGVPDNIRNRAAALHINLDNARIINPRTSRLRRKFADLYTELRKHKGANPNISWDLMTDVSYFGTMMVHLGEADGMVSGAVHTTQHTIRPAFEIIKTREGTSIVSSVFVMCLRDRVLVYGDCAVNPNPTAEHLADIALASADTAVRMGLEPRVAMLSYSTGESGKGSDVEAVREATAIARKRRPDLPLEGPIQYDAAIDASVARTKMPDSKVAGRATVFIFPDLNTGNNTYKAVQRSADAVAIGPVLQGLNKPVNDLSRGCTVTDIVNTVAITAIQAQEPEP